MDNRKNFKIEKKMLFQLDLFTLAITLVLIATIGTSFILFLAGTYMMQKYAKSKTWDESYKLALKINLIWLVSSLVVGITFSLFAGDTILIDFLRLGINMVVGFILVKKLYKKTPIESLSFVLALQIILYIIAIILGNIFNGINLLIIAG
ncbi:MAG: hypothetical protein KGD72_11230 [Candidatus Lokiarchaeota archaeon]|nr:hypothetical protein [Candidatus Lokiarchaeota archaeon]